MLLVFYTKTSKQKQVWKNR